VGDNLKVRVPTGSPAPKFRRGDTIPVNVKYDYKGMAQEARFKFELGTGVYPTYFSKYTWSPEISIQLAAAMDWESREFDSTFKIPTSLDLGLYNTRGTLRTISDVTQEIDTDWSAIEVVA
jgi:hypothetical protein